MSTKAIKTGELVTLIEEIDDLACGISNCVDSLNVSKRQSLDNDFSEPLVMAEQLVKHCQKLMNAADELAEMA